MLKSRRNKHLTADRAVFSGIATANQPAQSMSRSLLGLVFSSDGWTLSGSAFTLSLGTSGIDASGETSGTNIISSKLSIGTGTNIWKVGTGGTLQIGRAAWAQECRISLSSGYVIRKVSLADATARRPALGGGKTRQTDGICLLLTQTSDNSGGGQAVPLG